MAQRQADEARESSLASGWVVEPDAPAPDTVPATTAAQASPGDPSGPSHPGNESGPGADQAPPSQVSNLSLVLLGVFGGLYLLYTWVWITWAQYYSAVNAAAAAGSGSIGGVLQQVIFWAVPLAPVLWFVSAVALSVKRTGRLATALIVGAVVLFPLPMVLSSGAAL